MPTLSEMAILGSYFEQFYARLLRMVERRIDPRLRSRISPADIVQDSYVEAHRRWKKSEGTEPIECYVWWYGIARDVLVEAWRKNTRDMRDLNRDVPLPSRSSLLICREALDDESPSANLRDLEERDQLLSALAQLSDSQQEVLWMRHFDKLSHREIGTLLDCTERAAISRYARALTKLKQIMEESG